MGKSVLIILGAGKQLRRNISDSLIENPLSNDTLLDWQLAAGKKFFDEIQYVAGYQAKKLISKYPNLKVVINQNWRKTGPLGSLSCISFEKDSYYTIHYGDVLLTIYPKKLKSINNDELLLYYDPNDNLDIKTKEKIYLEKGRPLKFGYGLSNVRNTYELCGIIGAKGSLLKKLLLPENNEIKFLPLSSLAELYREKPEKIICEKIDKNWIEINTEQEFAKQVLGTKADNLNRLRDVVKFSYILDQFEIEYRDWINKKDDLIYKIKKKFNNSKLIIRSSAISEDGFQSAYAGVYESVLNVKPDKLVIRNAINKVFKSYKNVNIQNQVLLQPMLNNVKVSGVVFTRSIDIGSPYYSINYDDKTGLTDTVTSGKFDGLSTVKILRKNNKKINLTKWQKKLLIATKEIENLLSLDELDIEFAIDTEDNVCIFQVRPIASIKNTETNTDNMCFKEVIKSQKQFHRYQLSQKNLVFAKMADWNPAEMIGTRPNKLSYSLYCQIITDRIWAKQRFENENKDLRGQPLMEMFCGQPFINVTNSIRSFIPYDIDSEIEIKIIDVAISIYKSNPHLHDKLEFEVIPTCFDYNKKKWKKLYVFKNGGLTEAEFEKWFLSLKKTTKYQIQNLTSYVNKSKYFNQKFDNIKKLNIPPNLKIQELLFFLEEYGTIAFAHLARCGFISVSILRSARIMYPKKANDIEKFQSRIKTISTRYTTDVVKYKNNNLSKKMFLKLYGHLRPESYNIYSKTYMNSLKNILPKKYKNIKPLEKGYSTKTNIYSLISNLSNELDITNAELSNFIEKSIFWREEAKYIFTKGLSLILDIIADYDPYKLYTKKNIHFLTIGEIISLLEGSLSHEEFKSLIKIRKRLKYIYSRIELPEVIKNTQDFEVFILGKNEINFIGNSNITAEIAEISTEKNDVDIYGKIVIIKSADPGYDWIFSHQINGLITEYGGANSHMAIRAAEYNIPAAIGVGSKIKDEITKYNTVKIDCVNRILKGIF